MKRALGMIAITGAGAGLAFFCCTEQGRRMMGRARQMAQDCIEQISERFQPTPEVEKVVEEVVAQPHEDTAVARAFEAAIG